MSAETGNEVRVSARKLADHLSDDDYEEPDDGDKRGMKKLHKLSKDLHEKCDAHLEDHFKTPQDRAWESGRIG